MRINWVYSNKKQKTLGTYIEVGTMKNIA